MMRIIIRLVFLVLLNSVSLQVQAQKGWQVGARAGVIGVPYQLSANRLGNGVRLGLFLAPDLAGKTGISFSADYRKVDNLAMEKQEQLVVVLPERQYRSTKYLSNSGFASISLGVRGDREIKSYQSGKLKMYLESHAELLTEVRAVQETIISAGGVISRLIDDPDRSLFGNGPRDESRTIDIVTTDIANVVFVIGMGMTYEFASGPQIMGGIYIDLNTRFSTFAGSSDAKLTQLQIGFNYPFNTKLN